MDYHIEKEKNPESDKAQGNSRNGMGQNIIKSDFERSGD